MNENVSKAEGVVESSPSSIQPLNISEETKTKLTVKSPRHTFTPRPHPTPDEPKPEKKRRSKEQVLIPDDTDDFRFDQKNLEYPLKEDSLRVQYYYKSLIDKATYEEIQKKVIPKQYVIDYVSKMASQIKTALAILPDRMATRLAQESDEETVHHLLLEEIMYITQNVEAAADLNTMDEQMKEEVEKKPLIRGGKVSTAHKGF